MELSDLGFNSWFRQKWDELNIHDCSVARITRVDRDRYLLRNEQGEVQGEPTGKLLFSVATGESLPCVGDWVVVQYFNEGTLAIIHDVLPRKTFLHRKAAGKKVDYQMIASNIDVAFIMQSCDFNFNLRRMERYLVMARDGGIEPIILLSKSDLIGIEELESKISEIKQARIDAKTIPFSSVSGAGIQTISESLEKGKTYCLLGSSGVGKTTLLNHLLGREEFETNEVREKDGRGKHTTARRQLSVIGIGALLIDTPGMRELGMMGVGSSIDDSFSDVHMLSEHCRFRDCTHTSELGCAVLAAVESGGLDEELYRSYMKLVKESKFNDMSYIEKRQKDKDFGRMVNTAMKQMGKRKPR
jgi:ribosome biogenesis GTPase / thiamine phosphate phosphatase